MIDVRCGDQQYQQDEADVGNPVEHGLHPCGQVPVARLQGKPGGEREQHQQDEGATNIPRINSDPREHQRHDDRQVTDRDDHQKHHRANGKCEVALGKFGELRQERRTGRAPEHQQSNCKGVIESKHLCQGERAKAHQDEIGQQRQQDKTGIAQRFNDLPDSEPLTHCQHA